MSEAIASLGVGLYFYKHEATTAEQLPTSLPAATSDKWRLLGEIKSISLSGPDSTIIDVTHLASPQGWKEFKRGFKNGGELTAVANFIDVEFARYLDMFADTVTVGEGSSAVCVPVHTRWWEIRIPDDDCGTLYGRFSSWGLLQTSSLDIPEDDVVETNITIKLTSYPTFTLAAGNTPLT